MDLELHYKLRRKNLSKKALLQDSDCIVFFGDSITEICKLDKYVKYPFFNAGISGDSSQGLLERMEDNVLVIHPKYVVLLVGINDLGSCKRSVDEFISIYEKIFMKLKETNAKVLAVSVLPVSKDIDVDNKAILASNKKIEELCHQYHYRYADIYSTLIGEDGYVKEGYLKDGLHPNAKGYRFLFEILNKEIDKMLGN